MYEFKNEKTPFFKFICSYVWMRTKINRMNKRLAPKKKRNSSDGLDALCRRVNYLYSLGLRELDLMETSRGLNNQTFFRCVYK